jgi:hypothetical protein
MELCNTHLLVRQVCDSVFIYKYHKKLQEIYYMTVRKLFNQWGVMQSTFFGSPSV